MMFIVCHIKSYLLKFNKLMVLQLKAVEILYYTPVYKELCITSSKWNATVQTIRNIQIEGQ